MNCTACAHYNRGQGTRCCLSCDKFKDLIQSRPRIGPPLVRVDKNIIENIISPDNPTVKSVFAVLSKIDPYDATIILQSTILRMTHEEIADYHRKAPAWSREWIRRKKQEAIRVLKMLL